MNASRRPLRRLIAAAMSGFLFVSGLFTPETAAAIHAAPVTLRPDTLISVVSPARATLRRLEGPAGAPTLVLIEDIHSHAEAQENIAALLGEMATTGQLDGIAVEGAEGPVALDELRAFPAPSAMEWAARALVRAHHLSGGALAALAGAAAKTPITGLEDGALYRANIAALKACSGLENAALRSLQPLSASLTREETSLSPAAARWASALAARRAHRTPLPAHIAHMARMGAAVPSRSTRALLDAAAIEPTLDLPRVEIERRALLERLATTETAALARAARDLRAGRVSAAGTYALIERLWAASRVSAETYPALRRYLDYRRAADQVDGARTLDDARLMEDRLTATLAAPRETDFFERAELLHLSRELVRHSLGATEWTRYRRLADTHGTPAALAPFERFYAAAVARDAAMASRLPTPRERGAAAIVGGFHADSLARAARARGWAVARVVPRITRIDSDGHNAHLASFTAEKTPLDRLFEGRVIFLSQAFLPAAEKARLALAAAARAASTEETPPDTLRRFLMRGFRWSDVRIALGGGRTRITGRTLEGQDETFDVPNAAPADVLVHGGTGRLPQWLADITVTGWLERWDVYRADFADRHAPEKPRGQIVVNQALILAATGAAGVAAFWLLGSLLGWQALPTLLIALPSAVLIAHTLANPLSHNIVNAARLLTGGATATLPTDSAAAPRLIHRTGSENERGVFPARSGFTGTHFFDISDADAAAALATFPTMRDFMRIGLFDPEIGYYPRHVELRRHFSTTPTMLSPLFGEILLEQAFRLWSAMRASSDIKDGEAFVITELAAGDGTLARDVLRHLAAMAADTIRPDRQRFAAAVRYEAVESSPRHAALITERNRADIDSGRLTLVASDADGFLRDRSGSAEKPKGLLFANEFVDARPAHQIVRWPDGRVSVAMVIPLIQVGTLEAFNAERTTAGLAPLASVAVESDARLRALTTEGFRQLIIALHGDTSGALRKKLGGAAAMGVAYVDVKHVPEAAEFVAARGEALFGPIAEQRDAIITTFIPGLGVLFRDMIGSLSRGAVFDIDYSRRVEELQGRIRSFGVFGAQNLNLMLQWGLFDMTTNPNATEIMDAVTAAGGKVVHYGPQRALLEGTGIDIQDPSVLGRLLPTSVRYAAMIFINEYRPGPSAEAAIMETVDRFIDLVYWNGADADDSDFLRMVDPALRAFIAEVIRYARFTVIRDAVALAMGDHFRVMAATVGLKENVYSPAQIVLRPRTPTALESRTQRPLGRGFTGRLYFDFDDAQAPRALSLFHTIHDFIALGLFHPQWGYYGAGRVDFVRDFTTIPRGMSPLFGAMVSEQIYRMWGGMVRSGAITNDEPFTVTEIAAGDGTFAFDIVHHAQQMARSSGDPDRARFFRALTYEAVDISERNNARIRERNRIFIAGGKITPVRAEAASFLEERGRAPRPGVVLSNEFFDALPAHQAMLTSPGQALAALAVPLVRAAGVKAITSHRLLAGVDMGLIALEGDNDWVALPRTGLTQLMDALQRDQDGSLRQIVDQNTTLGIGHVDARHTPDLAAFIDKNQEALDKAPKNLPVTLITGADRLMTLMCEAITRGFVIDIDYGLTTEEILDSGHSTLAFFWNGDPTRIHPIADLGRFDMTNRPDDTSLAAAARLAGARTVYYGHQSGLAAGTGISIYEEKGLRVRYLAILHQLLPRIREETLRVLGPAASSIGLDNLLTVIGELFDQGLEPDELAEVLVSSLPDDPNMRGVARMLVNTVAARIEEEMDVRAEEYEAPQFRALILAKDVPDDAYRLGNEPPIAADKPADFTYQLDMDAIERANPGTRERIEHAVTNSFSRLREGIDYDWREGRSLFFRLATPVVINGMRIDAVKCKGTTFDAGQSQKSFDIVELTERTGTQFPSEKGQPRARAARLRFTADGRLERQLSPAIPEGGLRLENADLERDGYTALHAAGFHAPVSLGIAAYEDQPTEDGEPTGVAIMGVQLGDMATAGRIIESIFNSDPEALSMAMRGAMPPAFEKMAHEALGLAFLCGRIMADLYTSPENRILHLQLHLNNWGLMANNAPHIGDAESIVPTRGLTPAQTFGYMFLGLVNTLSAVMRLNNQHIFQRVPLDWARAILEGYSERLGVAPPAWEFSREDVYALWAAAETAPLHFLAHPLIIWLKEAHPDLFPELAPARQDPPAPAQTATPTDDALNEALPEPGVVLRSGEGRAAIEVKFTFDGMSTARMTPDDIQNVLGAISMTKAADRTDGRSRYVRLQNSSTQRGITLTMLKAKPVTYEGGLPRPERYTAPNQPSRANEINASGIVTDRPAHPHATGGGTRAEALNEYFAMLEAWEKGIPTGRPVALGRFTSPEMRFEGDAMWFVIIAVPEEENVRLDQQIVAMVEGRGLTPEAAAGIAAQALSRHVRTLAEMHRAGITHEQPNPSQSVLLDDGRALMADFTNAKRRSADGLNDTQIAFWMLNDYMALVRTAMPVVAHAIATSLNEDPGYRRRLSEPAPKLAMDWGPHINAAHNYLGSDRFNGLIGQAMLVFSAAYFDALRVDSSAGERAEAVDPVTIANAMNYYAANHPRNFNEAGNPLARLFLRLARALNPSIPPGTKVESTTATLFSGRLAWLKNLPLRVLLAPAILLQELAHFTQARAEGVHARLTWGGLFSSIELPENVEGNTLFRIHLAGPAANGLASILSLIVALMALDQGFVTTAAAGFTFMIMNLILLLADMVLSIMLRRGDFWQAIQHLWRPVGIDSQDSVTSDAITDTDSAPAPILEQHETAAQSARRLRRLIQEQGPTAVPASAAAPLVPAHMAERLNQIGTMENLIALAATDGDITSFTLIESWWLRRAAYWVAPDRISRGAVLRVPEGHGYLSARLEEVFADLSDTSSTPSARPSSLLYIWIASRMPAGTTPGIAVKLLGLAWAAIEGLMILALFHGLDSLIGAPAAPLTLLAVVLYAGLHVAVETHDGNRSRVRSLMTHSFVLGLYVAAAVAGTVFPGFLLEALPFALHLMRDAREIMAEGSPEDTLARDLARALVLSRRGDAMAAARGLDDALKASPALLGVATWDGPAAAIQAAAKGGDGFDGRRFEMALKRRLAVSGLAFDTGEAFDAVIRLETASRASDDVTSLVAAGGTAEGAWNIVADTASLDRIPGALSRLSRSEGAGFAAIVSVPTEEDARRLARSNTVPGVRFEAAPEAFPPTSGKRPRVRLGKLEERAGNRAIRGVIGFAGMEWDPEGLSGSSRYAALTLIILDAAFRATVLPAISSLISAARVLATQA